MIEKEILTEGKLSVTIFKTKSGTTNSIATIIFTDF